ncbi:Sodium:solute symporter family protein [Sulfidibacter corallicola]|uniref:Sodium:solute symporter family protein n=1 Tax=Sulfidibacter corallicola TaxID=2818388 RepID=A0A8A4TS52_SULCO|nr:sodium:solute symporter family protein [Sulfidibacter corallicola]QTD49375.1 sodium:solute symporter family protein [Sulfidibacter corallicola]
MIYLTAISLYLGALIMMGVYKSKKIKTQSDFAVAGRSLSPWVLVGTMLATWVGTGSILGNAGKAYETGLAALMLPIGGVMGVMVLTRIAGKVRGIEKFTVPEIIGSRYGQNARVLSVVALVMAYMVIVSYQYNAGGAVLHTVLTDDAGSSILSLQACTAIAVAVIIAYTMLAGLVSVAYTDVVNGVVMTLSFVIALPILWHTAGGWSGMEQAFAATGRDTHMQFWGVYSGFDIVNFLLPPFLLAMGDANMYQRFSASSTSKGATKATILLVFAVIMIELAIISSAWISSSMIPDAANGRNVLIYASHQFLPTALGAIMLTTMVGIIISTADSFLLVPATTLIRDVYLQYVNPDADERRIVLLSRLFVLGLGLIAYAVSMGFAQSATFFDKALYAYTIYGAAITPSLVAAFFWKRATSTGAVASIIAGTVVTLVWKEAAFIQDIVPGFIYQNCDEVLPAIFASILCLVSISLLTPKPGTETLDEPGLQAGETQPT